MATILDKIVAHKREEVARRKVERPVETLQDTQPAQPPARGLRQVLAADQRFHFICEIKKASPSQGIIREDFDPIGQGQAYAAGGASAISCLTDEKFFMGQLAYLREIRDVVNLPILRKDFIIDEYQIHESRAAGADLILLIAAILTPVQIQDYIAIATERGLDVLLELDDETEISKIAHPDKIILGINSRDLRTFEVDLHRAMALRSKLPEKTPVIAESGIRSLADCLALKAHGFCGALIGETLMRAADPTRLLRQFVQGSNDANTP